MPKYITPKHIKESEVFEKIKEAIDELCPVKQPRIELNDADYFEEIKLGIYFGFYTDDDGFLHTKISCVKSNGDVAVSASNYYIVDKEISDDTIGKLVAFLLSNFPYINSVETNSDMFEIEFVSGLEYFEQKGISCNKANIRFTNMFRKDIFVEMFQNYLSYIVSNFTTEMIRIPLISETYNKSLSSIKEKIISSFSYDELQKFISLLNDEELRKVLICMNTENFFEVCDKFGKDIDKPKSLNLIKEAPNKLVNNK